MQNAMKPSSSCYRCNVSVAVLFVVCGLSACGGGNAIDAGAPASALQPVDLQPLPAPITPGFAASDAVAATSPVLPAATFDGTEPANGAATGRSAPTAGGPRVTGTYPNINQEPAARLEKGDAAARKAIITEMQALQKAHAEGLVTTAAYQQRLAYLKRLAKTHSRDKLQQITGQ